MVFSDRPAQTLPSPFFAALILSAGFAAFTAWDQSHWWANKDDYNFGWLVPIFVGYVVQLRWSEVVKRAQGKTLSPSPSLTIPFGRVIVGIGLVVGSALFILGAAYRAAAGPSYSGTLAITLGMIGSTVAMIYFTSPRPPGALFREESHRQSMVQLFIFPLCVWVVSAPMITFVESNLNVFLMRQVTSAVFFTFEFLGLPLEQQGNLLILPSGNVGVAEACSGIRSLTGCLFAGSFLAAVFVPSYWKQIALVGAALVTAVLMNLARSMFLTAWAYTHGAKAIEGAVHDVTGYSVLGLTVVVLMCIVPILSRPPRGFAKASGSRATFDAL